MSGEGNRKADTGFLPVLPPRFALVELAIFAAIVATELWIETFPDLTRLNPHPYWIAVLLLSLQYGTVSGLLAAGLSIVGSLMIGLPEAEIGESYFNYLIRVWTQPVLWIVVALLLGSFRMRQIEERDGLQRQVDEATAQSASLSGYSKKLKARVDGLERQIAATARPQTAQFLDALASLDRAPAAQSPERRIDAARMALSLAFPTAKHSVFAVELGGLTRSQAHNWPDNSRWRTSIRPEEPLAQAVIGEGRELSILRAADDSVLAGEGKVAVPVFAPDSATVIGMIKLEELPARDLDGSTGPRLAVLARHIAPMLVPGTAGAVHAPSDGVIPMLRRWRMGGPLAKTVSTASSGMTTTRAPIEPTS